MLLRREVSGGGFRHTTPRAQQQDIHIPCGGCCVVRPRTASGWSQGDISPLAVELGFQKSNGVVVSGVWPRAESGLRWCVWIGQLGEAEWSPVFNETPPKLKTPDQHRPKHGPPLLVENPRAKCKQKHTATNHRRPELKN